MICVPFDQTRPIGIVREYGDLVDALNRQRQRRGMTMLELDDRAGFYEGYSGHVFAWQSKTGRALGALSLPLLLEALGVALAVVEVDPLPSHVAIAPDAQLELPLPVPERARYSRKELSARRLPDSLTTKLSHHAAAA